MSDMVLRVGLTGGIASGKSEVSARLRDLGGVVIDADALAREAVAPETPALAEVVIAFGPEMVDGSGRLDRTALGKRVFTDLEARRRLESILHPRVRDRAAQLEAAAPADAVVIHDIPLLVETGQAATFDKVVVVDCPPSAQLERLVRLRGMHEGEARSRIAAQASRQERLTVADYVLDNTGSVAELRTAVDQLWRELTQLQ